MRKYSLVFICLISFSSAGFSQLSTKTIQTHIKILASDSLEGRGTGSAGEKLAIDYIQNQ